MRHIAAAFVELVACVLLPLTLFLAALKLRQTIAHLQPEPAERVIGEHPHDPVRGVELVGNRDVVRPVLEAGRPILAALQFSVRLGVVILVDPTQDVGLRPIICRHFCREQPEQVPQRHRVWPEQTLLVRQVKEHAHTFREF